MTPEQMKECGALAYAPDDHLKRMLGEGSMKDVFGPEKIRAAERVMEGARGDFFRTAKPLLEEAQTAFRQCCEGSDALAPDRLAATLNRLRDRARTLGFSFIGHLCGHLLELNDAEPNPRTQALLIHLMEALALSFTCRIENDGGEIGQQITESLRKAGLGGVKFSGE